MFHSISEIKGSASKYRAANVMQAGAFTLITLANASSMKECAVNTDKLQGFHCLLKCVKICFSEVRSNSVKMGVRMHVVSV